MQAEALLHQRDGSRLKFGLLEFFGGQLSFSVHSVGMLLKGAVNAFTFESVFASTTYGV